MQVPVPPFIFKMEIQRILLDKEGNKFFITDITRDFHSKFGVFDKKDLKNWAITIISYDLWVERFNKNEDVLDQFIEIDRAKYKIIGVMPKGFSFPMEADLWLPISGVGMLRGTN